MRSCALCEATPKNRILTSALSFSSTRRFTSLVFSKARDFFGKAFSVLA